MSNLTSVSSSPKKVIPGIEGRITNAQALLSQDEETKTYLRKRGFTYDTITNHRLGVELTDGRKWLVIPHIQDFKPVNIKYRSLSGKKEFRRITGCPSILFNLDGVKGMDEIIITEGELDCISLLQNGFNNIIAITCGAGSFQPEWVRALEDKKKIYLCFDNDSEKKENAGQEAARKLAKRLGYDRVRNILLPVNDVNDFFKAGYSPEDFKELIEKAKAFKPSNLLSIPEVVELALQPQDNRGLDTEWENVNRLTGKFKPGNLIVLSATPKTGKTTLALQIAIYNAMAKMNPVLFYCLEMSPQDIVRKMCSRIYQKELKNVLHQDLRNLAMEIPENSFIIGSGSRNISLEVVEETIRAAVRLYGIDLCVFDHLHFLVRSLGHQTQEVGNAVQAFKLLATELEIVIILIAQPTKRKDDSIISMNDLRDSSMIGADADQVLVLHRKRIKSTEGKAGLESTLEPKTVIRIDASRTMPGGDTMLYYQGELSYFRTIKKEEL